MLIALELLLCNVVMPSVIRISVM